MILRLSLYSLLLLLYHSPSFAQGYDTFRSIWFTNLQEASLQPDRVYQLDLSSQNLSVIPNVISQFKNLEALKLSDNNIRDIEQSLKTLTKLQFLELSGNKLTHIDCSQLYGSRDEITELYLRDNYIQRIDSSINVLRNLELLNLGNNKIKEFSNHIELTELRFLYIDINRLKDLPSFITRSHELRVLNINNNQIQKLSLDYPLHTFENINIGDNPCDSLYFGDGFDRLQTLIMDWIDIHPNIKLPQRIETLSMEHCNLNQLPQSCYTLRKLKELSVMQNKLDNIQPSPHWKKLRKLWIAGNPMNQKDIETLESFNIEVKLGY